MDRFRKLLQLLKRHYTPVARRIVAGAACITALIMLVSWLSAEAEREGNLRVSAAAAAIEKDPNPWLSNPRELSDMLEAIVRDRVEVVAMGMAGRMAFYTDRDGGKFSVRLLACGENCTNSISQQLIELRQRHTFTLTTVRVDPRPYAQRILDAVTSTLVVLVTLVPALLLGGLMIYQMRAGNDSKVSIARKPDTRFDDIIGAESAKRALRRVAAFMTDPKRYVDLGGRVPRGVLVSGPPGTGKTLLAKALAGECNANFLAVDGSYFSSMYFGIGIRRVQSLFKKARALAPCIVFLDEFDGVGRRGSGGGSGEGEQNRIINRILVELDGFESNEGVVVVAATNHPENLDEALRRPGRFDLSVKTELPTQAQRERLFALYTSTVKTAPAGSPDFVDVVTLARLSAGMSPAAVAAAVNAGAAYAAENGADVVRMVDIVKAIETQQMGGEVTATDEIISEQTRYRLGVHEGGHALVAHALRAGSVSHVSVESREHSLGATYVARQSEEPLYGEQELRARLAMLLAGREAELMVLGSTSTGAGDDLRRATELAVHMISEMGFGETIGLLSIKGVPQELLGPDIQQRVLSEAQAFLARAQVDCRRVLEDRRAALLALARELVEHGTLGGPRLADLLGEPCSDCQPQPV